MLNDIINLYFQIPIVDSTLDTGLNDFLFHGTILSPLVAVDYILNSGDGKSI